MSSRPPSQRVSQIRSTRPEAMTAASATRTAITKSLITSLAKCRKGPRNINMSTNHSLPQRPASHRFASEPQVTQSQTPDYDARRDRGREGHQYPRVARAKPGRLRPKWGHRRVRGKRFATAPTTINICSQLREPWNSVHRGHLPAGDQAPAHRVKDARILERRNDVEGVGRADVVARLHVRCRRCEPVQPVDLVKRPHL